MSLTKPQLEIYTDPARYRVVVAGRRFGKQERNSNKILTGAGWKTFASIVVGDKVFDEKGNYTEVTGVFPQGKHKIWRVHFDDGVYVDTGPDHKWTTCSYEFVTKYKELVTSEYKKTFLKTLTKHLPMYPEWATKPFEALDGVTRTSKTLTTKEIKESLKDGQGNFNHYIPRAPINGKIFDYRIDFSVPAPIIYGSWLADRDYQTIKQSIPQQQVIAYLYDTGRDRVALLNSIYRRSFGHRSGFTYYDDDAPLPLKVDEELKDIVTWLLASCGVIYTIKEEVKGKQWTILVHSSFSNYGGARYINDQIIFKPKAVLPDIRRMSQLCRKIVDVEILEEEDECTCISVDSPSHLYLTGRDLVPTHNSILSLNELLRAAQTGMKQEVWYIAPTYRQAKNILWPLLKDSIPKRNLWFKNETDLQIGINGYQSIISLKGAENPDSLRGSSISFLVMDEVQGIPLDTFDTVVYPAMTDQKAHGIFIGTPMGKGNNAMYQMFLRGKRLPGWKSWQFTTEEGGNVPKEELEMARAQMTEKQYRQEFLASFEVLSGRIYYNFDLGVHVNDQVKDYDKSPLLVGIDFNVTPMCAVLGVDIGGQLHIFDEIRLEDSNTEEVCRVIKSRFPHRKVHVFPDSSGKGRSTKATFGMTDHTIIKSAPFNFSLFSKSVNPSVADRINNVNYLLKDANGKSRLYIHPRCKYLIESLDGHTYKDGTNEPDKTSGLDHMNDAIGYLISYKYSIIKKSVKILEIDWTY